MPAGAIPVQDSRGYRVDFHALRHTFASLLAGANVSELARVKLARHSEWKMTDRYTDPRAIPLFSEMDKVVALLPSQTVSQISKPTGQNASNCGQSADVYQGAKIIDAEQQREPRVGPTSLGGAELRRASFAAAPGTSLLHPHGRALRSSAGAKDGAQGGTRTSTEKIAAVEAQASSVDDGGIASPIASGDFECDRKPLSPSGEDCRTSPAHHERVTDEQACSEKRNAPSTSESAPLEQCDSETTSGPEKNPATLVPVPINNARHISAEAAMPHELIAAWGKISPELRAVIAVLLQRNANIHPVPSSDNPNQ